MKCTLCNDQGCDFCPPEKPLSGLSVIDLTNEEQVKFARVLKTYFPWLWTEDEDISGSDTISELNDLAEALGEPVE
jgi:hypothetical protein